MSKVKFRLSLKGLNELMKSPEMQNIMQNSGEKIRNAAAEMSDGGEFEAETHLGSWASLTYVRAIDKKAVRACFKNNVLEKAKPYGRF